MKVCSKCKEEKENGQFPMQSRKTKNGVSKKVRRSECKACYNEYIRNYLKGNNAHKNRVKSGKILRREFVTKIKLETGCKICKYNKCASSLHYHHINPEDKEFEISWAVNQQLTEEKILAEISKCALLCANCHGEVEEGITKL